MAGLARGPPLPTARTAHWTLVSEAPAPATERMGGRGRPRLPAMTLPLPQKLAASAAPTSCPDIGGLNTLGRGRCDAARAGWQFPPFAPKSGARYASLFG